MSCIAPALTDGGLYTSGQEHDAWAALRRTAPVTWLTPPGFDGFWAVTSHAAAGEVLGDWERFTSTQGTILRPDTAAPYPGGGRMLALLDPPRHGVVRHPLRPLFSSRAIEELRPRAVEVIRRLLLDVIGSGTVDFVAAVASRLTLPIAGPLLDIPPTDEMRVATMLDDGAGAGANVDADAFQGAHLELLDFYADRLASTTGPRTGGPVGATGMVEALRAAGRRGADISDEDIILTCDNVAFAAAETTKQAAAVGIYALATNPAQWELLHRDPAAVGTAVEEVLRWSAPARHVARTAVAPTVVAGSSIAAGDTIAVWIASANRDETVFAEADRFLVRRAPNRHLTFGLGHHFCLGAPLTRLLLSVLLDQLLDLVAEISVEGRPTFSDSFVIGGLAHLPVELSAR